MRSRIVGALFLGLLVTACGTTPSVSSKVVADGALLPTSETGL